MRQFKVVAALAVMCLTLFSGCSSSSSSAPTPTYSLTATAGGTAIHCTSCIAGLVSTTLLISGTTVTGGVGGTPQIDFNIASWSGGTGTFAVGGSSGNTANYVKTTSLILSATTGSVTIATVSSTLITGTFNFTCTDGTVVSAGTFSAKRS